MSYAEDIKLIVRGRKTVGLYDRLIAWCVNHSQGQVIPGFITTERAVKQLKLAGFSKPQIDMIREAAMSSTFTVADEICGRHPYILENNWVSMILENFQVYSFFLNVDLKLRNELTLRSLHLFDQKIDKLF